MATFRRGAEAIQKAMEPRTGPRFVNSLWLKENDKVYVQFLTPIEEMITALYHGYIITGIRKDGKPKIDSFVSRKDSKLDGSEGYDPIWDRGHKPSDRTFSVVAELEPEFGETVKGRKPVVGVSLKTRTWEDKDGNEHVDPVFSVAAQSQSNFYGSLITWEEESGEKITDRVWSITKRGKSKDVRYDFFPLKDIEPVDLSDVDEQHFIDLEQHLLDLADKDRFVEKIDSLPKEWTLSNYGYDPKLDKYRDENSNSKAAPAESVAADDDPPFEPDVKKSKSGFAALKARVGTDDE
jgi:single-stranded DNA-binding protein